MQKRNMKLVIILKASVLSCAFPKTHESKAPAPQTLQKTTMPSYPYSSRILQSLVEAKEL